MGLQGGTYDGWGQKSFLSDLCAPAAQRSSPAGVSKRCHSRGAGRRLTSAPTTREPLPSPTTPPLIRALSAERPHQNEHHREPGEKIGEHIRGAGDRGSGCLTRCPRQTYRSRLALAERLCRKTDRIDPTRVRRPCGCLGRGAPTPDSASLCPLLQRSENAPLVGQRCAILAPGAADRKHSHPCAPRRPPSSLRRV